MVSGRACESCGEQQESRTPWSECSPECSIGMSGRDAIAGEQHSPAVTEARDSSARPTISLERYIPAVTLLYG